MVRAALLADPVDFNVPVQPADSALLAFARQANVEVLFSFDDLHRVRSAPLTVRCEPQEALDRMLAGTGYAAQRSGRDRFVVTAAELRVGSITGRLFTPSGGAAAGIRVMVGGSSLSVSTDASGAFTIRGVPAGTHRLRSLPHLSRGAP